MLPLILTVLFSCHSPGPEVAPAPEPPQVLDHASAPAVLLSRRPDLLDTLELPSRSRPADALLTDTLVLSGTPRQGRTRKGATGWHFRPPIRSVHYGQEEQRFPFGMDVLDPQGQPLKRSKSKGGPDTWVYKDRQVVVRIAGDEPPTGYKVRFPRGLEEERSMSLDTAELSEQDFALRSLALDQTVEHGVYLPAPARAAWTLTLPEAAWLQTTAWLLSPPMAEGVSDGAEVVVEVVAGGQTTEVGRQALKLDEGLPLGLDLSAWAGQEVQLVLRTESGATGEHDYVFLAEPSVFTPVESPRRMVVFFVDTLRHDHLGAYGYERDTTPNIDALAAQGVVFEEARAAAPWTLPSVHSFLTGRHPDEWSQSPTHVAELLGQAGWVSVGMFTNSWMARTFGIDQGWSVYWTEASATVEDQVRSAQRLVDAHPHQDVMVMVHIMEPHMPYKEPLRWKGHWAGSEPEALEGQHLDDNTASRIWKLATPDQRPAYEQYVLDRYDQNVAWTDESIQGLIDHVGPEATVVVFADHGEEFWEHGEIGHGFNLYEEAIHVPLVVRAPGLQPARIDTPVTLLDLPATLVDLAGGSVPEGAMRGRSLVPLMRGEEGAAEALADRPIAMSHAAFRDEAWGVLVQGRKWIATDGGEEVYDLQADPGEKSNLVSEGQVELAPYHQALSEVLERPVHRVWRVAGAGSGVTWKTGVRRLEISHPEGFDAAWIRPSPKEPLVQAQLVDEGTRVLLEDSGITWPREIFLRPRGDVLDPQGLKIELTDRTRTWKRGVGKEMQPPDGQPRVLLRVGEGHTRVELTWAVVPDPLDQEVTDISGSNLQEELEALGYVDK